MQLKYSQILSCTGTVLLSFNILSSAQAGETVSCASWANGNNDFGDASAEYAEACHQTDAWQSLGEAWSADNGSSANDDSDDGVTWRTSSDGGITWSEYGNESITQGDLVEFQFSVNRSIDGNHAYDELKAWVDWDSDYSWDNSDEVLIDEVWAKNETSDGVEDNTYWSWWVLQSRALSELRKSDYQNNTWTDVWNDDLQDYNSAQTHAYFYSQIDTTDIDVGQYWLRARVVCENSLSQYSDNYALEAWGYQDQGEVEDYLLTITASSKAIVTPIPEPAGLALFALGFGIIGGLSRRQK